MALPDNDYKISYTLNYNHSFLRSQYMDLTLNPEAFESELARARTFCLKEEADDLQGKGLGRGLIIRIPWWSARMRLSIIHYVLAMNSCATKYWT